MNIILQNIKAPIEHTNFEAAEAAKAKLAAAGITAASLAVVKKSIDARSRNNICYICSVLASVDGELSDELVLKLGAVKKEEQPLAFAHGSEEMTARPLVVGFGPCGIFSALILAAEGYNPIVIERGGSTQERVKAVEAFNKSGILNEDSNIQFGAGGAGTFSDGKLVTRINDSRCSYVLSKLVELGAPEDILVNAKPHIGTDLLRAVVDRAAEKIVLLGGEIHYNTKFLGYERIGRSFRVSTTGGDIEAGAIILALGHSARDTYGALEEKGFVLTPKAFSVGVRIEHLREDINIAMYGKYAEKLPAAEYQLSRRIGDRGVYTFCMCPGGEVVAAASEKGGVVVNGMSRHARNGKNSNCAMAVSVLPSDYGSTVGGAIMFQRMLEQKAYMLGGGNYSAPVSTVGDFMKDTRGTQPKRIKPTYMGGKYTLINMNKLFPSFVSDMLKVGIEDFGKKLRGFDTPDAVLTGAETRTSAPIRIERGEALCAIGNDGIYPAGEGAGYAGGITSAAVDGIRAAEALIARYKAPIMAK